MLSRLAIVFAVFCSTHVLSDCIKDAKGACVAPKKPAGEVAQLDGVFVSLEQGDYSHWQMRTRDGKARTFFLLNPDASLNKVLDAPEKFVGKKCRVRWRRSIQNIPESGGDMELEEILSVKWL